MYCDFYSADQESANINGCGTLLNILYAPDLRLHNFRSWHVVLIH